MLKIKASILALLLVITFSSCKGGDGRAPASTVTLDREGNEIILPERMEKICSIGPSNTEIFSGLGLAGKIIVADNYSKGIDGLSEDVLYVDMMAPDMERVIRAAPDILVVSGMPKSGGDDPYRPIADAGICVAYMSQGESLEDIYGDILYLAEIAGVAQKGEDIVSGMKSEVEGMRAVSETIPESERKTVYFEIASPPALYSFGSGVFLQQALDITGAVNIFEKENRWLEVSSEAVVLSDPDVILTSVDYLDDPVADIMGRTGWEHVAAVENSRVYYVSADACTRPSQNIIKGLKEIAACVYPDYYGD